MTRLVFDNKIIDLTSTNNSFATLDSKGTISIWSDGDDQRREIRSPTLKNLCQISLGDDFGMVIDEIGSLYTWGSNINGELGFDDRYPRERLS